MPTYRHSCSETMFCRFRRTHSHQTGLAERFCKHTLLFIAFSCCFAHYTPKRQILSTLFQYCRRLSMCPDCTTGTGGSDASQGIGFCSSLFSSFFTKPLLFCYCLPHTQKICTRRRCLRVHAYSIANTSRSSHLTSHGLPRSISESSAR